MIIIILWSADENQQRPICLVHKVKMGFTVWYKFFLKKDKEMSDRVFMWHPDTKIFVIWLCRHSPIFDG